MRKIGSKIWVLAKNASTAALGEIGTILCSVGAKSTRFPAQACPDMNNKFDLKIGDC